MDVPPCRGAPGRLSLPGPAAAMASSAQSRPA